MKQFDEASKLEMEERDTLVAQHRARIAPLLTHPGLDVALDCFECGAEIPEERRRAFPGIMVCVDCKRLGEEQKRRGIR